MKLKIISGGQTGADIGGLSAARSCNILTGGCAAKEFKTEDGHFTELESLYGLVDKGYDYVERTKENVRASDITLIFADKLGSAGTKLTIDSCKNFKKPYKVNPPAYVIEELLTKMGKILPEDAMFVINVAGNRESVAPGVCARTANVVSHAIHMWNFKNQVKK